MSANFCTWDGFIGQITSNDIRFTTNEKFDLGFEYDTLYYEPAANNSFKILKNEMLQLTDAEIQRITKYQAEYSEKQDYPVWAYDDHKLYLGEFLKSEAISKGYSYTLIGAPDHPASKLTDDGWKKVKMAVLENGSIILDPASFCVLCLLGFTEEEYKLLPARPSLNYLWDFKSNGWYDPRSLEDCKFTAISDAKGHFDHIVAHEMRDFTPYRQMDTWIWQVKEAEAFQAGVEPSATTMPYLWSFLENRTNKNKPTMGELCQDVLDNHRRYLKVSAEINALLWDQLNIIQQATTNAEVDAIMKDVNNLVSKRLTR